MQREPGPLLRRERLRRRGAQEAIPSAPELTGLTRLS
jgi:hypothetical protein